MQFDLYTARKVTGRFRRGGLSRGWAVRRLLRAGDRGDPLATNVAWELWFETPDPILLAALSRWARPHTADGQSLVALGKHTDPAEVAAAACRTPHPIAATARGAILAGPQELVDAACEAALSDDGLAAFCAEHRLAPSDPHRAAVYFLLTQHHEQYRLVDPDHSLLAVAYRGASEEERARVRAEAAGEPELVRALAGTVARRQLGDGEAEYLVDAFASRRDWPALWALVKDLPVFDAARAVRRFDGWRPDGADGALFDVLAAADVPALTVSYHAVATPAAIRFSVLGTTNGSIAPDGRHVVVGSPRAVTAYTFPDARPLETWPTRHNSEVLALDDGVRVFSCWDGNPGDPGFSAIGYLDHPVEPFATGATKFHKASALARTADGFAALTRGNHDTLHLHLLSGHGPRFLDYERRTIEVCAALGIPAAHAGAQWAMAVEPETGLIAFGGPGLHLARITDDGLRPLATAPFSRGLVPRLAFSGPDRLIGQDDDRMVRVWRIEGDEPHLVAERKVRATAPVDLAGLGVIAMIDLSDNTGRSVRFLDRDTLADVPLPARFDRPEDPTHLFVSPGGDWFGVGNREFVEVFEVLLSGLVTRPLAATTPADLPTVRTRLGRDPVARPLLELLQACLGHRFGGDIALGTGGPVDARSDDIVLGGQA